MLKSPLCVMLGMLGGAYLVAADPDPTIILTLGLGVTMTIHTTAGNTTLDTIAKNAAQLKATLVCPGGGVDTCYNEDDGGKSPVQNFGLIIAGVSDTIAVSLQYPGSGGIV